MTNFTEDELEQACIEWFQEANYSHIFAPDLSNETLTYTKDMHDLPAHASACRHGSDVFLKDRLQNALSSINPTIPQEAVEEAFRKITIPQSSDLITNNKTFHKMITDGVDVQYKRPDGTIKTDKVWLFDTKDLSNNDWLVTNQFTVVENNHDRRPDIVVFVNGLPLVVIELKSESDENVNITKAYNQIQTYIKEIPSLFVYNCFTVISDGVNARAGTITANEDWFMMWRTIEGKAVESNLIPQLEVLIKGMFKKQRFIDLIKHFIIFQTDSLKTKKIIAGYHQYHAVNKAVESTFRATKNLAEESLQIKEDPALFGLPSVADQPEGDRKIGVIWHTQGSGKSLSMVFYAGKIVLAMDNPTIVVITDRNDLDEQLFNTFSQSKDLLRQTPEQASNRKKLRELLSCDCGGIIFTTIQKFDAGEDGDTFPVLSTRKNIIVIADEAHRTQYGLQAKTVKKDDEIFIKYGFARYMREALPNASFIGFTGTPIEKEDKNTAHVFGEYIDIYDISRAVEDGTTVKIFYESRLIKLNIPDQDLKEIDSEYEEITEYQEDTQREKLKNKWSKLEAIVGADDRIKDVAKDIVDHFEGRINKIFGKAMIVAMSRRIAVNLYNEIIKLRPLWHDDDLMKGKIKVVMTGSASDPSYWQKHTGNKKTRKQLANRMKDVTDPLQLVIVRDMWLTGFDVPCLHTMYVDKPMSGHNLMQAIARVNRVFKDKPAGLVVDYIGIADSLKRALSQYTDSDKKSAGLDIELAVRIMMEKFEIVQAFFHKFDYKTFFNGKPSEKMRIIVEGINFILSLGEERKKDYINHVIELTKAQSLCSGTNEAKEIDVEVSYFKAVKSGIIKLIETETSKKKTSDQLDFALSQLISRSVMSEEVIDIFESLGMEKPDISILSDDFLEEVKNLKQKNIAVELLNKLLRDKIRKFAKKNLIQSKKFSEMLQNSINKYINRTIETTQIILELIELAKSMNEAHKRGEDLGLNDDEIAFYDALGTNDAAVKILGDEVLKQIAKELSVSIKKNLKIDWMYKESIQAQMRVSIKRLLKKYGYPPDKQKVAVETVMKQAELMCQEEVEI